MGSIIILDDDAAVQRTFTAVLKSAGHTVRIAGSVGELLSALDSETFEVALVDVHLPDRPGDELIPELHARDPYMFVVIVTGDMNVERAVSAIKRGAHDYITKPCHTDTLRITVAKALDARRALVERDAVQRIQPRALQPQRRILGSSHDIASVNLLIDRVAHTPSTPVLITGESGTGKELCAHAIHELSTRRDHPLIKVNCAAIPRPLVESELFGHERGAFTDAREMRKGLFELADGGTIFLDEIGELEPAVQPKLLRVLEDHTITRLGSDRPRRVDIRVIAATNRDLKSMAARGDFRSDLYFRLAVMPIHMPALRDHPNDIDLLAHAFLREKCQELGRRVLAFSPEVLAFFRGYAWPGNVRELKNMVERMIILADSEVIELDPQMLLGFSFATPVPTAARVKSPAPGLPPARPRVLPEAAADGPIVSLDEMERRYLERALQACGHNKTQCARKLGISRSTLQRKIAVFGIRDQEDGDAGQAS